MILGHSQLFGYGGAGVFMKPFSWDTRHGRMSIFYYYILRLNKLHMQSCHLDVSASVD